MKTIKEAISSAQVRLAQSGIEQPRLEAELLVAYALGIDRTQVYTYPHRQLDAQQQRQVGRLVRRRCNHEPLAYITGERWFFGLRLAVTPAVLIPRPETEILVEHSLRWLSDRPDRKRVVVDVGTGSGAIAISIAVNISADVTIFATDISRDALDLALKNAQRYGVASKIRFLHGDLLAPLKEPVDLIVANLPYVAEPDRESLMPEVRDHEPHQALFSGPTGLDTIATFIHQAPAYLKGGGVIFLEIGYDQTQELLPIAHRHFPQAEISIHQDLARHDRILVIQTP